MTRFGPVVLVLAVALSSVAEPKEKPRKWQTARVKSAEQKDASGFTFQFIGPLGYKTKTAWLYTIETDDIIYELLSPAEMPLHLTINGETKIAAGKGSTYYLLDDGGRERRLTIYRKTARSKTPEAERLARFYG